MSAGIRKGPKIIRRLPKMNRSFSDHFPTLMGILQIFSEIFEDALRKALFSRAIILVFEIFARAYLFQIALEIMRLLTLTVLFFTQ